MTRTPRPQGRVLRVAAAALAAVLTAGLALAGCSLGGGDDPAPEQSTSGAEPEPDPEPEPDAEPAPAPDPGATPACEEVRAGIDAFNDGDFAETVARFEAAVPLAEDQADEAEGAGTTRQAELLLEAVRWYADLPPEDYPAASLGSPDFERYKQITLSQCLVGAPGSGEDGGDDGDGTLV